MSEWRWLCLLKLLKDSTGTALKLNYSMDVVFGVHHSFFLAAFFRGFRSFPWPTWSPAKPISLWDAVEEEIQEALEKMPEEVREARSRWSMAVQKRWWKWKEKVDLETDSFSFSFFVSWTKVYSAFEQFVLVQTEYGGMTLHVVALSIQDCHWDKPLSLSI